MSMVYPGLTHCSICGENLRGGIGICESCREKRSLESDKEKKLEFDEAMELLKKGKKIRRVDWDPEVYIYTKDNVIYNNYGQIAYITSIRGEWEEFAEENVKIKKIEWNRFNMTDKIFKRIVFEKLNEIIDKINKL